MFKLSEKEVQVLIQIDERIKELREKQQTILKKLSVKNGGDVEGFIKLETPDDKGRAYVRVTVSDNLEAFKTGEPMYRNAAFSRYGVDISRLKTEPKPTLTPKVEPTL